MRPTSAGSGARAGALIIIGLLAGVSGTCPVLAQTGRDAAPAPLEIGPPGASEVDLRALERDPAGAGAGSQGSPVTTARPRRTLLDLERQALEAAPGDERGQEESTGRSGLIGPVLRILGWAVALIAGGAGVLLLLRRFTPVGRALDAGGALRVLGRTSLTPRHSVFLVRLGNQRILAIGVSGDRMTTLSEVTDPGGILALDDGFQRTLEREAAGGAMPEEGDRASLPAPAGTLDPVKRLRDRLGAWRGQLGGRVATGVSAPLESGAERRSP